MNFVIATVLLITVVAAAHGNTKHPTEANHHDQTRPKLDAKHNKTGKIVGGEYAYEGQFPYMASLKTDYGYAICGGSIMCDRWILTAAHCYSTGVTMIGVGNTYLYSQTNYKVQYLIPHPLYDPNTIFNDIMLIKTASPIRLIPGVVQPISINTNPFVENYAIKGMVLSGWGQTTAGEGTGYGSDWLKWIHYNLQSPRTCITKNDEGGTGVPYNPVSQICALAQYPYLYFKGACFGDSGGPLVYGFIQYGITSRVMVADSHAAYCAVNYPDVFTKVSEFASWIAETSATY